MLPTIATGNVASALPSGYDVANSCKFNDGDSAYMHLTTGSSGNRRTFTFSCWYKRCTISNATQSLLVGSSCESFIDIGSNDKLIVAMQDSGGSPSVTTNRVFRDVGAWYHICIAVDTTQVTDTNRIKIFINGTIIPVADLTVTAWPSSSEQATFNDGNKHQLGANCSPGQYLDGYLAEVCLIDGQALTPTSFGEFDSDSPTIFKPIDVSGLTFGSEGWYLDFKDSADLGDDESGNTNDFTEVNFAATDQATDTPTNNFCTMNSLDNYFQGSTFSQGNLEVAMTTSGVESYNTSTFAVSKGKWYCEVKYPTASAKIVTGVASEISKAIGTVLANEEYTWAYEGENGNAKHDGNGVSYGNTYTTNDIISIALDLDNNKLYFAKNGTWQNSGDPTSGATGTGAAHTVTAASLTRDGVYYFGSGKRHADTVTSQWNFGGCPAFAISSGNQDGNGYGNFEYAVPSLYYSLCSKNLAEYG